MLALLHSRNLLDSSGGGSLIHWPAWPACYQLAGSKERARGVVEGACAGLCVEAHTSCEAMDASNWRSCEDEGDTTRLEASAAMAASTDASPCPFDGRFF